MNYKKILKSLIKKYRDLLWRAYAMENELRIVGIKRLRTTIKNLRNQNKVLCGLLESAEVELKELKNGQCNCNCK
jgi:hypothetical protein